MSVNPGTYEGMTVRRQAAPKASRRFYEISGIGAMGDYKVPANTLDNAIEAVARRVLYYPNKETGELEDRLHPVPNVFREARSYARELGEWVRDMLVGEGDKVVPLTNAQYVASCPPGKRKRYEMAADRLRRIGPRQGDANVDIFVKYEKLPAGAVPRIISTRRPEFHLRLGRYLRRAEKLCYQGLAEMARARFNVRGAVITKGLSLEGKGTLIQEKVERWPTFTAIAMDASRFDQHICVDALKMEHIVYLTVYDYDPELAWLLKQQLHNKCRGRFREGTIEYEINGTRMSGDVNTALGNCVITCILAMILLETILDYLVESGQIDGDDAMEADLVLDGDDLVLFLPGQVEVDTGMIVQYYRDRGIRMKVGKPVHKLEEIEFCSARPVRISATQSVMVRPPHVTRKEGMALGCTSEEQARNWLAAVGAAGQIHSGGVPIWGALYDKYAELGNAKKVTRSKMWQTSWHADILSKSTKLNVDLAWARPSFALAYGVSSEDQISIEEEIRGAIPGDTGSSAGWTAV